VKEFELDKKALENIKK